MGTPFIRPTTPPPPKNCSDNVCSGESFFAGLHNLDKSDSKIQHKIKKIQIHPDYRYPKNKKLTNDIALVFVIPSINLAGPEISSVLLDEKQYPEGSNIKLLEISFLNFSFNLLFS